MIELMLMMFAVALAEEVLRGPAAAVPEAREVGIDDLLEDLVIRMLGAPGTDVGDACVVDQHVDRAELIPGRFHQGLDLVVLAHVAGHGQAAPALALDQRACVAKAVEAARGSRRCRRRGPRARSPS